MSSTQAISDAKQKYFVQWMHLVITIFIIGPIFLSNTSCLKLWNFFLLFQKSKIDLVNRIDHLGYRLDSLEDNLIIKILKYFHELFFTKELFVKIVPFVR